MSGVEYSKRICQSHCGLTDSLLSAQGPHPLSDRLSDLVRRVFLNEMHTLDLTSVCDGHERAVARFAPTARSAPGSALMKSLGTLLFANHAP